MIHPQRKMETCDFPGCTNPALCSSGNVNGALVCDEHFKLTNGKTDERLTDEERALLEAVAITADTGAEE